MRTLVSIVLAALLGFGLATSAVAQGKPGDSASSAFVGRWSGVKDFNGHEDTPYDGTSWWDLRADGSFVDNADETGTWSASGTHLAFQYNGGGVTSFTGTLIDDSVVVGTMHNSDSSYSGAFAMWRPE